MLIEMGITCNHVKHSILFIYPIAKRLIHSNQAKGYGYRLLSKVVNELKNQGFEEVFLWVLEDNHRARKFYEKFGFLCTGDYIEDSIGGKELREV